MMKNFAIKTPDAEIRTALQQKIDGLTKPLGSLGRLEELALQIGWIQQTLTPSLDRPYNIVFAGDHGVAEEKVSLSPKEVTRQMVDNFLKGGAGISFLCRQHGFRLRVVDAGVDAELPAADGLIDLKIRRGTRNFVDTAAMTREEMERPLNAALRSLRCAATTVATSSVSAKWGSAIRRLRRCG